MPRRSFVVPVLLLATTVAVAACGGTSAPTLSDPGEILTKAVEAMQNAKSVHIDATVDGTVNLDLLGTGQSNGLALGGTSLTADVDIGAGNVHLNLAIPAMLAMTAEVIVVDGMTYSKTSFTGEKFTKGDAAGSGLPIDAPDPQTGLKDLQEWLAKPEVDPKKLDDASCSTKRCYQVQIDLSAADLQALIPDAPDMTGGSFVLTVLIDKESLLPASVDVTASSTALGELTASIDLSNWNAALDIKPPPADQVQ